MSRFRLGQDCPINAFWRDGVDPTLIGEVLAVEKVDGIADTFPEDKRGMTRFGT